MESYCLWEPDLSKYIDADILQEFCQTCRLRNRKRRKQRAHKAQTFKRKMI
jgi:hypothetical protein